MIIRIYETKKLDLDTVANMLLLADSQANFHPDSRWIFSQSEGELKDYSLDEPRLSKRYKEYSVKWIGREAVITWLTSNQVLFEIMSHDFLPEEQEAIKETYQIEECNSETNNLN